MSACPFCFTAMQETFSQGLLSEECENCGALWLAGEMLEKVVGHAATDALLREAKGKPGQCKCCQETLQFVPNCPSCGRDCPTCPQCGTAPLPVAEVRGVKVDVCVKCRGIGLDANEWALLQEAAKQDRPLELDLHPEVRKASDGHVDMACATCARKLKPQHAFAWDGKLYCGSCAPSEAAPYEVELTRADPTLGDSLGYRTMRRLGETGPFGHRGGLVWLLSKLLD